MASDSGLYSGPSFCGNCGAPVESGQRACVTCGAPVDPDSGAQETSGQYAEESPPDYIPYCRNCGVTVPWARGYTCSRCGVAPLCDLHFRSAERLCLDCAARPANSETGEVQGGLRCGACGTPVVPFTDFCANCGVALAAPYVRAEYAGFLLRLAAFVADWVIGYLAAALIAAIIGISMTSGDIEPATLQDVTITIENFNYSFLILFCGISAAHGLIMTIWKGQTLGKMLLKIQVVDAQGNIPPWHNAAIRELLRGVILVALFPLGLLYIWVAFDSRKRGPHDYLGSSYVVRRQRSARTPSGFF